MPKMRNGETSTEQFSQWIGRKVKNHNPLAELNLTEEQMQQLPGRYTEKVQKQNRMMQTEVSMVKETGQVVCMAGPVMFLVEVRQVVDVQEQELLKKKQRVPIGG